MKEFLKKAGFSLCVIAAAFAWSTCEVGLGESIDNDAPTLTVTGPTQASVCADVVNITGTCGDDKGVKSVNITVRNTNTGATYNYQGTVDTASKSATGLYNWGTTINQKDPATGKYPLPDGKYVADVVVTDVNNRTSGVSSTAFDIDNTAPIFCVTSPTSLKISGSRVYGRSVTISGEIADDHDIANMTIRVFRTDASGSNPVEITSALAKTEFKDFETAGGTTVYVAKYFETEPPQTNPDGSENPDYALYKNYMALYENDSSRLGSDVFLYIFPTLTDVAGNKSEFCYVASTLRNLIASIPGVELTFDSLQTAQLQKIYNGTYNLKELNAEQQAQALEILKGNNPSAADYYCQYVESDASKQNCFGATVNSNNSPTYEFNGYENPMIVGNQWTGVNTGGTITVTLKAGRDGWGIKPSSLVVNLYEYDSTKPENHYRGALAFSSDARIAPPTPPQTQLVQITDALGNDPRGFETSVTSQSYYVILPSLRAGNYYVLETTGVDENNGALEALNGNEYGFNVATSIVPPTLTASDLFYIKGEGLSKDDCKLRIDIKDESDRIKENGVTVKGYIYSKLVDSEGNIKFNGHIPGKDSIKNYASYATDAPTNPPIYKNSGSYEPIKDGDAINWYRLDLPIKDFAFAPSAGENYTIVFEATANYMVEDEMKTSNPTYFMIWVDSKAPTLTMKSPSASLIDERFASYESDAAGNSFITPKGTWDDLAGSGTHRLWYTLNDSGNPSLKWTELTSDSDFYVKGTNYYEKQCGGENDGCYALLDTSVGYDGSTKMKGYYTLDLAPSVDGKTWTEITDISQVASETTWEKRIGVSQGKDKIFRVVGVDAVGNLTAVVGRTDIVCDFAVPTIKLTSEPTNERPLKDWYNAASATNGEIAIVLTVKDTYMIDKNDVSVTAQKWNADLQPKPAYEDVEFVNNGYPSCDITQTDGQTVTVTIKLNGTGTSDGKWKFTADATDSAGRPASHFELERNVDTKAPVFVEFSGSSNTKINGKKIVEGSGGEATWTDWDGSWYSSTGLVFNGKLNEDANAGASGLDRLEYSLIAAGSSASETATGKTTISGSGVTPIKLTVTGMAQNDDTAEDPKLRYNSVTITAYDKAGNPSNPETLKINVDLTKPSFTAAWYTYAVAPTAVDLAKADGVITSDGAKNMTLYGTVSSPLSGINDFTFKVAEAAMTPAPTVYYTTAPLSDAASYIAVDAESAWKTLGGEEGQIPAADSNKITGWKAVIQYAALEKGNVEISATNNAIPGKSASDKVFELDVDKMPPKIDLNTPDTKISSYEASAAGSSETTPPSKKSDGSDVPQDAASVNGTLKISGSASDDNEISSIDFYWSDTNTKTVNPVNKLKRSGTNYTWSIVGDDDKGFEFSAYDAANNKYKLHNGSYYDGEPSPIYIQAVALDKAQNKTVSVYEYSVNPDSDRPIITLTLPSDISAMTKDDYVLKTGNAIIRGRVEDDDGLTGLKLWYNDNGEADASSADGLKWTELGLTNGVFDLFNDSTKDYDTGHKILFKVEDAKGTVFVCSDGTEENKTWLRPKIYKETKAATGTDPAKAIYDREEKTDDTALYIQIDTKKPQILKESYKIINYNGEETEEIFASELGIVGGTRKEFYLYFYVKDESDIYLDKLEEEGQDPKITGFELNGIKYNNTTSGFKIAKEAYPDDKSQIKRKVGEDTYENVYPDNPSLYGSRLVTIGPIDVSAWINSAGEKETDTKIGKITVIDNAKLINEDSIDVAFDNKKPVIGCIDPSDINPVSGYVTAYGNVTGAKTVYYSLSYVDEYVDESGKHTHTETDAKKDPYDEWKPINQKSFSMWYVHFDDDVTNPEETETHVKSLNEYIIEKEVTWGGVKASPTTIEDNSFTGNAQGVVPIYLWIKAVDDVGNSVEDKYLMKLDPQGTRPEVSFSYPSDNGEVMGGEIKIYGGASAKGEDKDHKKNTIKAVFAQVAVRASSAGAIGSSYPTKGDWDSLKVKGYKIYKMAGYNPASPANEWGGSGNPSEYGIPVEVSGTFWSLKMNSHNELNPESGTNNAAIRVKSYDGTRFSLEQERTFVIDADKPTLSHEGLQQYEKGIDKAATASREYKKEVYVSGEWYLTFDLNDTGELKDVSIGIGETEDAAKDPVNVTKYLVGGELIPGQSVVTGEKEQGATELVYKTLNVKQPLGTGSGFGESYVYVEFSDGSDNTVEKNFSVKYDNEAPVLAPTSDSDYSINDTVRQSNGWYSLTSKVSEPNKIIGGKSFKQSGVERVAFYFTRGDKIYDPMIKKGAPGNECLKSDTKEEYGLLWKSKTASPVSADSLNSIKLGSNQEDYNIHVGGLAKVDGTIYRIKAVTTDANGKTTAFDIDGSPKNSYTSVLVAVANVVDHEVQEGSTSARYKTGNYGFGYNDPKPSADDGDLMVESLVKTESDWIWNANIYSKNIPDGAIQIHYVAFDKAGNWACAGGKNGETDYDPPVVAATVCNNSPRIANINLGSDLNGDGEVDFSDGSIEKAEPYATTTLTWNQDYDVEDSSGNVKSGRAVSNAVLGKADLAHYIAKGMTVIKPEILGGNQSIKYSYKITKMGEQTPFAEGANPAAFITGDSDVNVETDETKSDTTARSGTITIQVGDFKHLNISDTGEDAPHKFEFTFTDSIGSKAVATIYMAVDMADNDQPKITRDELFWKSKGAADDEDEPNNSLVWNGDTPEGHIDLKDDLPSATFNAESGEMDKDDKVSGKIVLRGTVEDNKMLYRIYIDIPEMAHEFDGAGMAKTANGYIAAEYNAGAQVAKKWSAVGTPLYKEDTKTWTTINKLAENGIKFEVYNNRIVQYKEKDANGDEIIKTKHAADWRLTWDTSYVSVLTDPNNAETRVYGAALDVKVDVRASDQVLGSDEGGDLTGLDGVTTYAKPSAKEANVSAASGKKPDALSVDVVPYITSLDTLLSGKGVDSARTAKGHWPIYWHRDSPNSSSGAYSGWAEEFTVNGFNFGRALGTKVYNKTTKNDQGEITSQTLDISESRAFAVTVNGVDSLNNLHDDTKAYNLQPNGRNNNNLTDKVYIDVWQLNSKAVVLGSQTIETPVMKINPANAKIGYAFRYGPGTQCFAMPDGTSTSYTGWHQGKDQKNAVTFAYDSSGNSYATTADGESDSAKTDYFSVHSSIWRPQTSTGVLGNTNCVRIEMTGQVGKKSGDTTTKFYSLATKYQSPSITTAGSNVYLAYYDAFNQELRFRSSLRTAFATDNYKVDSENKPGNFKDLNKGNTSVVKYSDTTANCQIVAEEGSPEAEGGEYICIAAIPSGGDTVDPDNNSNTANSYTDDAVVMVWYDTNAKKMFYSYNNTPSTPRGGTTNSQTDAAGDGWSKPVKLFGDGVSGKYCKVAVDNLGGVHIAAQDSSSGSVWYAYLSKHNPDAEDCVKKIVKVDSGNVGKHLTIDVALNDAGTAAIPCIGYYASGKGLPKSARLAKAGTIKDGIKSGKYTGDWEISFVPSDSKVEEDNVNIGLWKTKDNGKINYSTTDGNAEKQDKSNIGKSYYGDKSSCYGNGSKNAVLGYKNTDKTTNSVGYVETAQLTGTPDTTYSN